MARKFRAVQPVEAELPDGKRTSLVLTFGALQAAMDACGAERVDDLLQVSPARLATLLEQCSEPRVPAAEWLSIADLSGLMALVQEVLVASFGESSPLGQVPPAATDLAGKS